MQQEVNDVEDTFADSVQIDLWDGLSSVEGYKAIRLLNATFYKTPHIGTWDNALTYHYNRLFALFSRRFDNWEYAADRVFESPFVWISDGATDFEAARSPEYVADQLAAAHRWGMGRLFAVYGYSRLASFDYGPYTTDMRSASRPDTVDDEPPELTIEQARRASSDQGALSGRATDNTAVRVVRWRAEGGRSGVAALTWVVESGDPHFGWRGHTSWVIDDVPLHAGSNRITVTAEDTKGLRRSRTITVSG